ncbi:MAG TPA: hypothetical protein VJN93_05450 [Candidatus Acidoferrum sp.]|nr:hypothetical protein [Candidatus Acidoferrum sp.]
MLLTLRKLLALFVSVVFVVPAYANGNTVSSGGIAANYDFENHLVQKGGVTIVYDGDGNRVSKTAAGVTTTYLVDTLNPTGYAQVIYESFSGGTAGNREQNHFYVYGLELISQLRNYQSSFNNLTQKIFYVAAAEEIRDRRRFGD